MFEKYKVISVTPAGRKAFLDILIPYLLRNQHVIDEHHFWVNTTNPTELFNLSIITNKNPFFKLIQPTVTPNFEATTFQFYPNCTDENTIYIRIDDDICYMDQDAIVNLLKFRIAHPNYFMIFPIIINHTMNNLFFDKRYESIDKNGEAAVEIHQDFLNGKKLYDPFEYLEFNDASALKQKRSQVTCWMGKTFKEFEGNVEDEFYHLYNRKPRRDKSPLAICGSSVMSHFAYKGQVRHMRKSELYQRYYEKRPNPNFPLF